MILAFLVCVPPAVAHPTGEYTCFTMPETIRVGAEGFRGVIEITSSSGCFPAHSATSTADWVMPSIPSPTVMPITIVPNTSGAARSAAIVFDGVAVATVVQGTSACVVSVTPPTATAAVTADAVTFDAVATSPDCYWNVTGFPPPLQQFTGARGWAYPADIGWGNLGIRHGSASFVVGIEPNFGAARSVTLTFGGGPTVTVTQPASTCQFAFVPTSVAVPANGGGATVNLTGTGADCSYSARVTLGSPWLTVTTGQSGTAPATLTITAAANVTLSQRTGQVVAGNAVLGIVQAGPPIAVDFGMTSGISFGAARQPDGTVRVTSPEPIRITNDVEPNASWQAVASDPWIILSPASGTTPATMRISIDPLALPAELPGFPPGFLPGLVAISSSTAPQTALSLGVPVLNYNGIPGTQLPVFGTVPIGSIDTPTDGAAGLSGAVPITGWAVDRVGLTNVRIYRAPVAGEPPGLVPVGDPLRVFGSRPDLLPAYAGMPESRRAGWGYMLLSNVLPNRGNGTFTFSAYAEDVEGNNTLLGSKTVTFDNANASKPFGTIDSPAQGETVSGTILNRGWVLTPLGKTIPFDGSTIKVYIDGVLLSPVSSYNNPRPDVKAFFPGFNNSDGPEARLAIDTTLLADGVHTIAWGVIDDGGVAEGIGSRYFTVQNGMSSVVSAPAGADARSAGPVNRLPMLTTDVWSREGVDEAGWAMRVVTDAAGKRTLYASRGQRIELFLDPTLRAACGTYTGHLMTGEVAGPLPAGASLEAQRGNFRWQPTAAVSGAFEFVFVQHGCDGRERRIPLTVAIGGRR